MFFFLTLLSAIYIILFTFNKPTPYDYEASSLSNNFFPRSTKDDPFSFEEISDFIKEENEKDDNNDDSTEIPPKEKDDDIDEETKKTLEKKNFERRKKIREAFLHSFSGYEKEAWGFDEIKPISGSGRNWVEGGIGMTIIDALDTAFIMGLDREVQKSLSWIKTNLRFDKNSFISVFETTIRIVGGLLSAYDLIGEQFLLEKAAQMADRLLPAFNSPTGIPFSEVNLVTGAAQTQGWTGGASLVAEFGTLQLEFRKLSYLTKDPKYEKALKKIEELFIKSSREDGQYPCFYDNRDGHWRGDLIKWGAWGDSAYEYFIKQFILTDKTQEKFKTLHNKAVNGMHKKLIKRSGTGLSFLIEVDGGRDDYKMDHLVCFVVGMLVLGAESSPTKEKDINVARELGKTCYEAYHSMASGLAPDSWRFSDTEKIIADAQSYLLRPETVEAMFYLFRETRDEIYRDWGWEIFLAIEKHCKTSYGFTSVSHVTSAHPPKVDEQHTFWLAETLKYLYLLFSPTDLIPLDQFVFNTEAHPLKIIKDFKEI